MAVVAAVVMGAVVAVWILSAVFFQKTPVRMVLEYLTGGATNPRPGNDIFSWYFFRNKVRICRRRIISWRAGFWIGCLLLGRGLRATISVGRKGFKMLQSQLSREI
jgi:hypothetical protein